MRVGGTRLLFLPRAILSWFEGPTSSAPLPSSRGMAGPASSSACLPAKPHAYGASTLLTPHTIRAFWPPGGMSVSQCSKEDGRSSSGPPHETAAPKRTYDMMEGRVGRTITSASIEGECPATVAHEGQALSQEPPRHTGWNGKGGGLVACLEGASQWLAQR